MDTCAVYIKRLLNLFLFYPTAAATATATVTTTSTFAAAATATATAASTIFYNCFRVRGFCDCQDFELFCHGNTPPLLFIFNKNSKQQ